jgi:hypothetical protein
MNKYLQKGEKLRWNYLQLFVIDHILVNIVFNAFIWKYTVQILLNRFKIYDKWWWKQTSTCLILKNLK